VHTFLLTWALGLGTGLGLIVAIGAQNAFLLRLGVTARTRVVLACVGVAAVSDILGIGAGVAGVGVVVDRFPAVLVVLKVVGCAFLAGYGVLAGLRAIRPARRGMAVEEATDERVAVPVGAAGEAVGGAVPGAQGRSRFRSTVSRVLGGATRRGPLTLGSAVLTCLAFTWLNPHFYLDSVVFLGSLASQQPPELRWWFAAGAMTASLIWFGAIGAGARFLRPVLSRPGAWRVLDGCIAVVMLGLAVRLALGV
jgi:L-lysine exporter family protein LysE/ArgO